MKILWKGNIFNPTGIATANRETVKALLKRGHKIQVADIWHSGFDFNKNLHDLNKAIDVNKEDTTTIFADYPQHWREGVGKLIGCFVHEGTKLHPGWAERLNIAEKNIVPSKATKNLFKWNGVETPIEVVPYGVNPDLYKPGTKKDANDEFIFLSVNSWTLQPNDRKGIALTIKAFDEEFKDEQDVKLLLKVSTFWRKIELADTVAAIREILGHDNPNILVNVEYLPEEKIATFYKNSDCFVMPTRGESFGLTAINAMACGLPIIITKDPNSGHMDFCRGKDSVLWIDAPKMEQADPQFFAKGNMQPVPDLDCLKKQMRYAFENRKEMKEKALEVSKDIRENWTWDKTAEKFEEAIK